MFVRQENTNWRVPALMVCCLLTVAASFASFVVLKMMPSDTEDVDALTPQGGTPILLVFSVNPGCADLSKAGTLQTDNAIAWLVNKLLREEIFDEEQWRESIFVPAPPGEVLGVPSPPRNTSRIWPAPPKPSKVAKHPWLKRATEGAQFIGLAPVQKQPYALVTGAVLEILSAQYELLPPQLQNMQTPVADAGNQARLLDTSSGAVAAGSPDVSALLASYQPLLEKERLTSRWPVLVSHPYTLPYLSVLAKAAGVRARVLHPALFSRVPLQTFGCGPLGFAEGAPVALSIVEQQQAKLEAFATDQNKTLNAESYSALLPVIEDARLTLRFHACVAKQDSGNLTQARLICSPS